MRILVNRNWPNQLNGYASLSSENVAEAIAAAILPDQGRFVVRQIVQDEDTVLEAV